MTEATFSCLERLGNTPDEIAESLSVKQIKGSKREPHSCPIAQYLRGQYPRAKISVCHDMVRLDDVVMSPPKPVRDFIHGFDMGDYPNLQVTR